MSNLNTTANRLIDEKSPYLLQHAHNPVDWYPWGSDAFDKAREEDKPVFLSIGYSTCHWCHVMERESFEDTEVAEMLNNHFVSIKVDREERPDVDSVYMNVAQRLNGSGGWPLTIIMTPEQKPFFAGTYIPKKSRYGMTGLTELLEIVRDKWKNNKHELIRSGNRITDIIRGLENEHPVKANLSKDTVLEAVKILENNFDEEYGGFSEKPKFPQPSYLLFLLSFYALEKDEDALFMAEKTLECMFRGGMFDHVGHGFSRYSTDDRWLVPHFEKMLYDNALLTAAYSFAYEATGIELYRNITCKVLDYVLKEMTHENGGFYSAQDADSDGEEGKYYVFTPEETIKVLGREDGSYFNDYYNITAGGNFEGKNIPNLLHNDDYFERNEKIEHMNAKLYEYRKGKTRLHKDDKILASWNGMMIAAFAIAHKVFGERQYIEAARKAMRFIDEHLIDRDGRLAARYREGSVLKNATVEDYAMVIWGLIELYECSFDMMYLKKALSLTKKMTELFWDEEKGGFFLGSKQGENLIYNPKETYDGAMPSGNSAAAYNLVRLSRLTGDESIEELSKKQFDFLSGSIENYPAGYTFALLAAMYELYPTTEVVCIAGDDESLNEATEKIRHLSVVNTSVVALKNQDVKSAADVIKYVKDYSMKGGKTTYYVCRNKNCSLPITDAAELEKELGRQVL
ncbi:MAG: thioredoxin domain-containing protein [Sedimentibacter sp.]|uniref:thioredoxin domain-containing protein n=1 Tax=Sedimentibacter sp. TaxID=1960295 RepID=UPI0031597766